MADITSPNDNVSEIRFYVDGKKADAANLNKPISDLKLRDFIETNGSMDFKAKLNGNKVVGFQDQSINSAGVNGTSMFTINNSIAKAVHKDKLFFGKETLGENTDDVVMNVLGYSITIPQYKMGITNEAWSVDLPSAPQLSRDYSEFRNGFYNNEDVPAAKAFMTDSNTSILIYSDGTSKFNTTSGETIALADTSSMGDTDLTNLTLPNQLIIKRDNVGGDAAHATQKIPTVVGKTYIVEMKLNSDMQSNTLLSQKVKVNVGNTLVSDELFKGKIYERATNEYIRIEFTAQSVESFINIWNEESDDQDTVTVTDFHIYLIDDIQREDLVVVEVWKEDVKEKNIVYPFGNVQYQGEDINGLTTLSAGTFDNASGYSDSYKGQNGLAGKGYIWNNLLWEEKVKLIDDARTNLFVDGSVLVQLRYRFRVIKGNGLIETDLFESDDFLAISGEDATDGQQLILAQGKMLESQDNVPFSTKSSSIGLYSTDTDYLPEGITPTNDYRFIKQDNSPEDIAHEGYCMVLPVATINRRNSGLYDPIYNQNGCGASTTSEWYKENSLVTNLTSAFQEELLNIHTNKGTEISINLGATEDADATKLTHPSFMFEPEGNDDKGVHKVWYTGSNNVGEQSIMYAYSLDNCTSWTKSSGSVLAKTEGDEVNGVSSPCVIVNDDAYTMWYIGESEDNVGSVHSAESNDGVLWTRQTNNTLIQIIEGEESIIDVTVIQEDENIYKMWFSVLLDDGVSQVIKYAESTNGITWTRKANTVLSKGEYYDLDSTYVNQPTVILDNGVYKMWYVGRNTDGEKSMYATSADGINWNKEGIAIGKGIDGKSDDAGIGKIGVIKNNTYFRVMYSGFDGSKNRLHFAEFRTNNRLGESDRMGKVIGSNFTQDDGYEFMNYYLLKGGSVSGSYTGDVYKVNGSVEFGTYRNGNLFFDLIDNMDIKDIRNDVSKIDDNQEYLKQIVTNLSDGIYRGEEQNKIFDNSQPYGAFTITDIVYVADALNQDRTYIDIEVAGDTSRPPKEFLKGMYNDTVMVIQSYYTGKFYSVYAVENMNNIDPVVDTFRLYFNPSYSDITNQFMTHSHPNYILVNEEKSNYNSTIQKTYVVGDFNNIPNRNTFTNLVESSYDTDNKAYTLKNFSNEAYFITDTVYFEHNEVQESFYENVKTNYMEFTLTELPAYETTISFNIDDVLVEYTLTTEVDPTPDNTIERVIGKLKSTWDGLGIDTKTVTVDGNKLLISGVNMRRFALDEIVNMSSKINYTLIPLGTSERVDITDQNIVTDNEYTIYVNSLPHTYTVVENDTKTDVVQGLIDNINTVYGAVTSIDGESVVFDHTVLSDFKLKVSINIFDDSIMIHKFNGVQVAKSNCTYDTLGNRHNKYIKMVGEPYMIDTNQNEILLDGVRTQLPLPRTKINPLDITTTEIIEVRNNKYTKLAPGVDFSYTLEGNYIERKVDGVTVPFYSNSLILINYTVNTEFMEETSIKDMHIYDNVVYSYSDEGGVYPTAGSRLKESLTDVLTDNLTDAEIQLLSDRHLIERYKINDGKFDTRIANINHQSFRLDAGQGNTAVKILPYLVKEGNNLNLNILYTELKYSEGETNEWGENALQNEMTVNTYRTITDENNKVIRQGIKKINLNKLIG